MTDQSAQHGQRLDDEMEHEVEALVRGAPIDSRAREELEYEPLDDATIALPDQEDEAQHRAVIERSELARFLRPSALPADADTVLAVATEEHAPDAVLAELARLPTGVRFATVAEIWEALGHETEHRDHVPDAAPEAEPEAAAAEPAPERADAVEPAGREEVEEIEEDVEVTAALPPSRPALVAPVPEPPSPGPVRGVVVFGLELVRAGLGIADRAIEGVERLLTR
jgi:hypothetical protein